MPFKFICTSLKNKIIVDATKMQKNKIKSNNNIVFNYSLLSQQLYTL